MSMDVQKTMEFILEQQAQTAVNLKELSLRMNEHQIEAAKETAALKADLRRAVRLGIAGARMERRRRQELASEVDAQITKLAAAQLITEERMQAYFAWVKSVNGHK
jgi:hypothetical protein